MRAIIISILAIILGITIFNMQINYSKEIEQDQLKIQENYYQQSRP